MACCAASVAVTGLRAAGAATPGGGHSTRRPSIRPGIVGAIARRDSAPRTLARAAAARETSTEKAGSADRRYRMPLLNFPLEPTTTRATVFKEVLPGKIYTLEQEQSFVSISTNIRCTIIVLESGGLWVHDPIAPTGECLEFIESIGRPVEHIVLSTFAIEHKIYVGPFARKFPDAQVWVAPKQWTYPVNIPLKFLGVPRVDGVLEEGFQPPWGAEIDHKVLVCDAGVGPFVEVAFFHRNTRTLVVTDSVVSVNGAPPEVVDRYNVPNLLKSANDVSLDPEGTAPALPLDDSRAARQRGWEIMALRVAFLTPIEGISATFRKFSSRLIVSPLIEVLVFSKALPAVREWCTAICTDWDFKRIIPAHYDAPIAAGPAEFRRAFQFAYESTEDSQAAPKGLKGLFSKISQARALPDLEPEKAVLRQIDAALVKSGVAKPPVL